MLMTCLPGTNQALIVKAVNELQAAHQIRTFDTPDGLAFALEDEETQRSQQAYVTMHSNHSRQLSCSLRCCFVFP